jgi:hypothetical protein
MYGRASNFQNVPNTQILKGEEVTQEEIEIFKV